MRLNAACFTFWTGLQLDVVVSVRRQSNHRILDDVAASNSEDAIQSVDATETLELGVDFKSTGAILNMDAVEVCGPPLKKHLDQFEAPCPEGRLQGGPLGIITSGIGQDEGPFKLPDNRLYVCNPNSKLKGALFKHGVPTVITSGEELESTVNNLFAEKLFDWATYPNGTSHRRNGETRKEKGEPKKVMLWVLDMDGNWIIGPETQEGGLVVKHGDFTPGEYPWKRPEVLEDSEQVTENSTLPQERRVGGNYRGLARAGGEIVFPPETGNVTDLALIEDSSSYAIWRANATGLDPHREMTVDEVEDYVQSGKRDPPMAMCAMKRLKEYLQGPVALSLSGAKVMARIVDPKTKADFYVDP